MRNTPACSAGVFHAVLDRVAASMRSIQVMKNAASLADRTGCSPTVT